MKSIIITAISIAFFLVACKQAAVEKNEVKPNIEREKLVKLNQYILKQEVTAIKAYITRRNWKMMQTETGLWYEILQNGNSKKLVSGQKLFLKYRLELLDGTLCYSSDSTGIKEVILGKGLVENGLEEGLNLMSVGGKARFILPSHLGLGVSGDGKCIPPRATIVYNVEILNN